VDCTRHRCQLREADNSGISADKQQSEVLEIRKPLLLLRLSGVLLRFADRRFCGLLLNEPPRNTREFGHPPANEFMSQQPFPQTPRIHVRRMIMKLRKGPGRYVR